MTDTDSSDGAIITIPKNSSALLKKLIPRVTRATLEEGDVDAAEDRANACFFVMCSQLANINDDTRRNAIIGALTDVATGCVAMNRAKLADLDVIAAEQGKTRDEMFSDAAGDPIPDTIGTLDIRDHLLLIKGDQTK